MKEKKSKLQLISNKISKCTKAISLNALLTYGCNFSCKHCYLSPERNNKTSNSLISLEEWKIILKKFHDAGTIYLRLSGGEPTTYLFFSELYSFAWDLGYKIELATNGYLLHKFFNLFENKKPFLITFSLYGLSDETYSKFCNIKSGGYNNLYNSILFCKTHDIPFKITYVLTNYNARDMNTVYKMAQSEGWEINCLRNMQNDTAGNAAPSDYNATVNDIIRSYQIFGDFNRKINHFKDMVWDDKYKTCFAGSTSFNVNPSGELYLCSSCFNIKFSIDEDINKTLFEINNARRANIEKTNKCSFCNLKDWCGLCSPIFNEKVQVGNLEDYCNQQKFIFNKLRSVFIMYYKLKYDYEFSEIEGEYIVTPKNGETTTKAMVVNVTTYLILKELQEKHTISEIVKILKSFYQVETDRLFADIENVIDELKTADLIEEYAA